MEELTPEKIEFEARKVIGAFPENSVFLLMGFPVGTPRLKDMTLPTLGKCMRCERPVQSTVVKDRILELSPSALLLCGGCYKQFLIKSGNYQLGYHSL